MRKIAFWILLVFCILSSVIIPFVLHASTWVRVLVGLGGLLASFPLAWLVGWLTEVSITARRAKIVALCDQTPEYVQCLQTGESSQQECESIPAMRQCIREQQREEDQIQKLNQILNRQR